MKKNTASQKWRVKAFDATGAPVTGDAANITAKISKDFGTLTATNDVNPTETEDGYYEFDLLQAETNADHESITPVSSTSEVYLVGDPASLTTIPWAATAGLQSVSADAVNDDSSSVAGLNNTYNGTGYSDPNAPATQEQVGNIGVGGTGTRGFTVDGDNTSTPILGVSFVGSVTSGTYLTTQTDPSAYHEIADTGDAITIVYSGNVNVNEGFRQLTSVTFIGIVTGNNDEVKVQLRNIDGATWETMETIKGQRSTNLANNTLSVIALPQHTADDGSVYIQLTCTGQSNPNLKTGMLVLNAVDLVQASDYADGRIWVKDGGSTGTTWGYDGIATRPVTWATALTLNAANGSANRFQIAAGTTITPSASIAGYDISGTGWSLVCNTLNIGGANLYGCVSITGTASGSVPFFMDRCWVGAATLPPFACIETWFGLGSGVMTAASAGNYDFAAVYSKVAGSGAPELDFSGVTATTNIGFRGNHGGLNATFNAYCTVSIETDKGGSHTIVTGGGNIEVRGDIANLTITTSGTGTTRFTGTACDMAVSGTGGTVKLYGMAASFADTSTGSTVTDYTLRVGSEMDLVDAPNSTAILAFVVGIWDRILNKTNHNIAQSAGKTLRQLNDVVIHSGTAQGPGNNGNQIQFDTGASAVDGTYDPGIVTITGGTGIGQSRLITEYDGTTKIAALHQTWKVEPDATSEFTIRAAVGFPSVNQGLIRAATSTTVQINALASTVDNAYKDQTIFFSSGTGEDQTRRVVSYVGSTQTVTLDRALDTALDTTTNYCMLPCITYEAPDNTTISAIATVLTGITSLANWLRSGFRKDTADATAKSEINDSGGTYNEATDSQEGVRDQGDSAWITGGDATAANQTTIISDIGALNDITAAEAGTDAASKVLTTPANMLVTDGSGRTTDINSVAIKAKTDLIPADPATVTNQTTILNRLGAITGTGVNTVLGFFKATLSKTASTPSDIGGTFSAVTDSTEAIRDQGDAAWTTGAGSGGDATEANQTTIIADIAALNDITAADAGTDAASKVLITPANKLSTNASGHTTDINSTAIKTKTDLIPADPATVTNQTTIINRLGTFTGTGVNTVLGFLKGLMSKAASTPSDVGGTFSAAADSTEAIRDQGDAAWTTGAGSGGDATEAKQDAIIVDIAALNDITAAEAGTDAASKVLVTPAQKIKTDINGEVTAENMRGTDSANTVVPDNATIASIDTNVDAVKVQTDKMTFDISNNIRSNMYDLQTASLAKFSTQDTGEITPVAGSVAKLSQADAISGDVTVGAFSLDALKELVETDTTIDNAVDGSVAFLAQGDSNVSLWTEEQIDTVINNTNKIGGASISVSGPVTSSGNIEVVRGDDYLSSSGSALVWDSDGWPDLTGATVVFTTRRYTNYEDVITDIAAVTDPGTGSQTITVELTTLQTTGLKVGEIYQFDIQATLASGAIRTLTVGTLTVIKDFTH